MGTNNLNSIAFDAGKYTALFRAFFAVTALVAAGAAPAQAPAAGPAVAATLLYVGNLPEIDSDNPGLAAVAGLAESLRRAGQEVQILHGGDSLAPSTLSAFDRGAHMIALLNRLDPVAMGVAKREFAFGEDELTLRAYEAAFPLLSNNIYDPATGGGLEGLVDFAAFRIGAHRVCATAAVSGELEESYLPDRIRTRASVASTHDTAQRMRADGCDVVIALFGEHLPAQQELLRGGAVDVVISAESNQATRVIADRGLWVNIDASARLAAVIDLDAVAAGGQRGDSAVEIVPLTDAPRSDDIAKQIASQRGKLAKLLAIPVTTTETALDTRRQVVRTRETGFGNLVADALRTALGADIGLVNSGGIRGDRVYPPGSVLTRGDIQSELPFRNQVTLLELSGAQLRAAIENGLARYEDVTGGFPQVAGLRIRFDPLAAPGQRVVAIDTDDGPLEAQRNYTLATVDFLARGGDGYEALTRARQLRSSINALAWESVRSYLGERDRIAPRVEDRIVNIRD